jgi:hydrogenase maturation factor
MSERFVGKPPPKRLADLLSGSFGAPSDAVLVGPGPGLDAAVLDLGDGRVMAVAEDPILSAPGLPLELFAWFTVHIGASDVAVTGVRPEFMTYTLLSPGDTPEERAQTIIEAISDAAAELGITIVGGHTGWYDAVTISIVGGVTVWGYAPKDAWISPGGAREGDILLMSKGPAIEAAALLGVLYRDRLEQELGEELTGRLLTRQKEITVVRDALDAFEAGGVHAMHDATEGGVLCGLWEMSAAAGRGVRANLDGVDVPEDIAGIARVLDFDPWEAIGEGTLLAAVDPEAVDGVLAAWKDMGVPGFVLGDFGREGDGVTVLRNGKTEELIEPEKDPFWDLFFAGLAAKA